MLLVAWGVFSLLGFDKLACGFYLDGFSRIAFVASFSLIGVPLVARGDAPPSSLCDPKWVQRVGFTEMARNLVPLLTHNTKRGRGVMLGVPGLD